MLDARNQLVGTLESLQLGTVMAEVVLDVGGQEVVAVITRGSAGSLELAVGDRVRAMIKSTDVLIDKNV